MRESLFDGTSYLDIAEALVKRDEIVNTRAAIGRAYYATFWAARDQALRPGVTFRELSKAVDGGTHKALIELYKSKSDKTANLVGERLETLLDLRRNADYEATNKLNVNDQTTAKQAIDDAKATLPLIRSVVWSKKR